MVTKRYVFSRRYELFVQYLDEEPNQMHFDRVDTYEGGVRTVRYVLVSAGYTFEINATKNGIAISGTTPRYTDYTIINQIMVWCQYQVQRLRETGDTIPQNLLERGEIS